ncbi:MAG: integrase arm-type DNA-binding domain-containing protein [Pseudomonadota bacterium]|nr:integrase arm-type DNA-binding domain-containing protein [Pseudomonadota bacterium]
MKMTADNIKDATAQAARTGKRVEVSDDDHRGLELGISPFGVQAWSLRTRDPSGRLRRFVLGRLPAMTPAAARKAARSLRAQVEAGYDPLAAKRAKRVAGAELRAGIGTLGALIAEYERSGDPPKTWFTGSGRKRVERVFGVLMSKPVREMKASDIIREADGYSGSRHAAQNAIRALRPVISWAVLRDYAPVGLKALSPEQGVPERDRVLTHDELRRLLPILRSGRSRHATVMLFILLTLARLNEVAGATWAEIDLDRRTWTIPPQRRKDTRGGSAERKHASRSLSRSVGMR